MALMRISGHTGVTPETIRAVNLALALRHILARPGEISRADIATLVGVTRATASKLVDDLIVAGYVEEFEPAVLKRGRPPMQLAPRRGAAVALGLEINVSYLQARVIDLDGTVLAEQIRPRDNTDVPVEVATKALGELAKAALEEVLDPVNTYLGAALAIPGLVNADSVLIAPNLGWRDLQTAELFEALKEVQLKEVANEADLAAYAVAYPRPGVQHGPGSFIYVSGETGVGAGIIIDHRPLRGSAGYAGEVGHVCVDPNGPKCACGANGCLEAFVGARALFARAGVPFAQGAEQLRKKYNAGDTRAIQAVQSAGRALGQALAGVINLVDIPAVYLGGHLANVGDLLVDSAAQVLRERTLRPLHQPIITIVPDSANLAATGAAHRILKRMVDDPLGEQKQPLPFH